MRRFLPLAVGVLLVGCTGAPESNEKLLLQEMQKKETPAKMISDEAVNSIINSIPSPLEISTIIKQSGGKYNVGMLNSHEHSKNYNSNFKRAVNLGIYSTDLGYINLYNQPKDALQYLNAVKDMADGLNIGHFFDMATIKRMATNSSNMDSLLRITTSNFEKINQFLQKNQRSEQSILILTGGWIEALHISCKVAENHSNPRLQEKIGEQKIVLDQLILLLSNYDEDPNVATLTKELKDLQKIFNSIEITYTYKESTMKEVDGMLVIVDESESKVNITDDHIRSIADLTRNIRKSLIG